MRRGAMFSTIGSTACQRRFMNSNTMCALRIPPARAPGFIQLQFVANLSRSRRRSRSRNSTTISRPDGINLSFTSRPPT